MRRTYVMAAAVSVCAAVVTAAGLAVAQGRKSNPSSDPVKPDPVKSEPIKVDAAARPSAPQLPVSRVILFSSGVGYFQRQGEVEGSARIDLSFPVQDINDLLKSMVLQDLDGGHVTAVSYDSQAPIAKTLQGFAVNLSANPSFGQILNQARGEKVEVVLQQSATTQPGTITGTIIGVEKQKQAAGQAGAIDVEVLNLWCAEGMRGIRLPDVQRVRFLNPVVESEFRKALEVLALSHDTQKKAVSLSFAGDGKRQVKVGYVIENPIWKTSYRLVLSKDGKPFLQGWAVVENTTDEDWSNVGMALVSGRPISFQMDLYQPLYVPRPMVVPELFASLRPPTYSGAMLKDAEGLAFGADPGAPKAPAARPADMPPGRGGVGGAPGSFDANRLRSEDRRAAGDLGRALADKLDLTKGVSSAASAAQLGDFFQYLIEHPVSLPRQKSAMLPIVNKPVEGTRVSIYNEHTHAKFPLLGLKFKNTSGLHLMQGPITVFEGSNYAGDARILDLQPNEERLLSYAVDLGTEVNAVPSSDSGRLTSLKINKGILHFATKIKDSKTYTIKNRSEQERVVLIEHPNRPQFKLTTTEKPIETASDVHRFQLKVPAGKTETKVVTEEQDVSEAISLTNLDDNRMQFFFRSTVASPAVKAALQRAGELRGKLAQTQQEIGNARREMEQIKQDQPRLRANLEKIPGTDPLAKRILEKLNAQETAIDKYEAQIKQLNATADHQRKEYENYLATLTVE